MPWLRHRPVLSSDLHPAMFIGAAGSFTFNQHQINVEFTPSPPGTLHHCLVHVCFGPGLMFLYVEILLLRGWVGAPAAGVVEVHDHGFSTIPALPPLA